MYTPERSRARTSPSEPSDRISSKENAIRDVRCLLPPVDGTNGIGSLFSLGEKNLDEPPGSGPRYFRSAGVPHRSARGVMVAGPAGAIGEEDRGGAGKPAESAV